MLYEKNLHEKKKLVDWCLFFLFLCILAYLFITLWSTDYLPILLILIWNYFFPFFNILTFNLFTTFCISTLCHCMIQLFSPFPFQIFILLLWFKTCFSHSVGFCSASCIHHIQMVWAASHLAIHFAMCMLFIKALGIFQHHCVLSRICIESVD